MARGQRHVRGLSLFPYAAAVGVEWIIHPDLCGANDLGHRIMANRVFEAVTRNCSFVACRMPEAPLIGPSADKYENGSDGPLDHASPPWVWQK